jgi:hypothetical protein
MDDIDDTDEISRTPRQQALIESIAHGEVGYMTHLEGFYFHRPLQFQFADEDQAYLRMLFESGVIAHTRVSDVEYDVKLREPGDPIPDEPDEDLSFPLS